VLPSNFSNQKEQDWDEVGDVEGNEWKGDQGVEGGCRSDIDEGQESADETDPKEGVERDPQSWVDL
jgi:hypothetical protein